MRILHVGKYYYPSRGGIETFLQNLAEGQRSKGDEVTVLCSSERPTSTEEWIGGVRIVRAGSAGKLLSQPLSLSLPIRVIQMSRRFDIVHVHTPNPLAESAAILIPSKIPLVVSHHSDVIRQKALLPVYSPLLRAFLKRASRVVVATENHIRFSNILPEFREKCAVVPYGLDPEAFSLTETVARESADLRVRHGRYVLFVGRLVGYKGVSHLITALQKTDSNLVIVGDGPLLPELTQQTRDLGLDSRVHFAGRVPDSNRLLAYYHGCEICVLPSVSKAEAFGLVQLEAMACQKPVIATRLDSGVTLVNQEGITGLFVEPGRPDRLAEAINSLMSDDNRRKQFGQAARKRFEELFSREKMVNSYSQIYSEAIES